MRFPCVLALSALIPLAASTAAAATWNDVTASTIGDTAEWSNKVELADLDRDGDLDILFANGGDYDVPGEPEPLRVFANDGVAGFQEITAEVFGAARFLARTVKVGDLTGDGRPDILVGTTYQTQSRLFVGQDGGGFVDATDALPQAPLSIGDLELGDVDGDGDLDVVLADWGPGVPTENEGGQPRLWLNESDAAGPRLVDATAERVPTLRIGMSWDMELVDVDNDRDLDALIASKTSAGSTLLRNDGRGAFADASSALPQHGNNYEFEAIDLDRDGFLDLMTINDGPAVTERIYRGDGDGFVDATADWLPAAANPDFADDNAAVYLDVDGDADPDILVGALGDAPERVLINDGTGALTLGPQDFGGPATPGTLGVAVGDLDGDGRLDVVQSQGELAFAERVYLAGPALPVDDDPPVVVELGGQAEATGAIEIVARIDDHQSPSRPGEVRDVEVRLTGAASARALPLTWYGEFLHRARIDLDDLDLAGVVSLSICAADRRGNTGCSEPRELTVLPGGGDDEGGAPDALGPGADTGGGCGCRAASPGGLAGLVLVALVLLRRRA